MDKTLISILPVIFAILLAILILLTFKLKADDEKYFLLKVISLYLGSSVCFNNVPYGALVCLPILSRRGEKNLKVKHLALLFGCSNAFICLLLYNLKLI